MLWIYLILHVFYLLRKEKEYKKILERLRNIQLYQKSAILCAKIRHLKNRTSPKPGARNSLNHFRETKLNIEGKSISTTVSIIPRLFIDSIVRHQLREKVKKRDPGEN